MQSSARLAASSASASGKVIAGISGTITRSCHGVHRGKSHVASLSAQGSSEGGKRIREQQRRHRVEEFVAEYRASNAGKFPKATVVRRQVGGSYYTIRQMVQELEYNHKMFLSEKLKAVQVHESIELDNVSSEDKEEPSQSGDIQSTGAAMEDTLVVEVVEKIEINGHSRSKDDGRNVYLDSKKIKEKQAFDDVKNISIKDTASSATNIEKGEASMSSRLKTASGPSSSGQMESGEVLKPEKLDSDHHSEQEHEGSSTKTNVWGSLKSFASGIMNLWKKL